MNLVIKDKTITVANKNKSRYITNDNLHKLTLFVNSYNVSSSLLVNIALDEFFKKYHENIMPVLEGSVIKVITKKKGIYLTIDNISKLSFYADQYKVSESVLINKALNEFFLKYD